MQNKPKFLTIAQAAEFLNVSPDTLRRWEDKGIVTPQRTKGGSRRYTLLDLKIAKLKRKVKQNYINSKRDLKIAILTSFLWIFGLLVFNFLTPIFLRPTNPEQHILSNALKEPTRLKIASETPGQINTITVVVIPGQVPTDEIVAVPAASQETDLLIHRPASPAPASPRGEKQGEPTDYPTLRYTDTLDSYYFLESLPQNPISSLIKRS